MDSRRILGFAGSLSPIRLDVSMHHTHPNLHHSRCPNLHLLVTFCRQLPSSGHTGMRLQRSISIS
jgi:hypothetical protein